MQRLTCPVSSIEYYNHDTRRVMLSLPEPVDFHAGQYLQVVTPEKKFPFSIASAPALEGQVELHIRPTPDSSDSEQIEALLDSGDDITIEIPLGDCFITEAPEQPLLLLAASTGVTQMKSIVESLLPVGLAHPVHLYWGVLADKDLYLSDLCRGWEAEHPNFTYVPVVSEPDTSPDWQGKTGLVGEVALADFDDVSNFKVITAGGPAMVYATLDAFVERGMPEANMSSDIFSYAPRK